MPRKKIVEEAAAPVVSVQRSKVPVYVASIFFATIAIGLIAMFIGKSDSGPIDVSRVIQDANEANSEGTQVGAASQTFQDMPNGGLVPTGNVEQPPVPEPQATTSATTTETGESTDEEANPTEGEGGAQETSEGN